MESGSDTLSRLRAINHDIWLPFSAAYHAGQPEDYLALNTADLIRGMGEAKAVMGMAEYAEDVLAAFARWRESGSQVEIAFRFFERIASASLASERGIFRLALTPAQGEPRVIYGQFHVFERRENDRWKIAIDYDSSEKQTIDETTYARATALEAVEAFA